MNLKRIELVKDVLLEFKAQTATPIYHYFCDKKPSAYVVWSEDSPGAMLSGDGKLQAHGMQGTVDYFTKKESNDADLLENMLIAANVPVISAPYVDYEDETGYIHYSWTWEVV